MVVSNLSKASQVFWIPREEVPGSPEARFIKGTSAGRQEVPIDPETLLVYGKHVRDLEAKKAGPNTPARVVGLLDRHLIFGWMRRTILDTTSGRT